MMNGHAHAPVVQKHRGFFSTLAWGLSLVLLTGIATTGVVGVYALSIVDRKTDNVFAMVRSTIDGLPELVDSLPPALADALSDQRRPDYAEQIEVHATLAPSSRLADGVYPAIQVTNMGDEVVSLLSMRVVVLNDRNVPVAEFNEWAATPIGADRDWRGPLLPAATRRMTGHLLRITEPDRAEDYHAEVEITDIRIWQPQEGLAQADAEAEAQPNPKGDELALLPGI